jgi:hypothetical protein
VASVVAVEGMETGSGIPCWASSEARSTGRAGSLEWNGTESPFTELTRSLAAKAEGEVATSFEEGGGCLS